MKPKFSYKSITFIFEGDGLKIRRWNITFSSRVSQTFVSDYFLLLGRKQTRVSYSRVTYARVTEFAEQTMRVTDFPAL